MATKYAEIIFEPGSKSIISYETEDELKGFVEEHHRRAVNGEPGSAQEQYGRNDLDAADFAVMPSLDRMKDRPAERIKKVYLYDKHPVDLHNDRVSANSVLDLVRGMADESGTLDHNQLVSAIRDEASPVYTIDQGRHESIFKADATGELDLAFLQSLEGGA